MQSMGCEGRNTPSPPVAGDRQDLGGRSRAAQVYPDPIILRDRVAWRTSPLLLPLLLPEDTKIGTKSRAF